MNAESMTYLQRAYSLYLSSTSPPDFQTIDFNIKDSFPKFFQESGF